MSKIALITDTHAGVRGDSEILLNYQKKFFDNIFFPELEKRKIKDVIHLGDVFDRRKYINFHTSQRLREDFLNPLSKYNVYVLAGNHDVYYKSTNEVNAFNEILKPYPFKLFLEAENINLHGIDLCMIPWINNENTHHAFKVIQESKADLAFGHLEINGFEMTPGTLCEDGISRKVFSKFECVFSGHFHTRSSDENIFYLGAPFEMNWSDHGTDKGFYIFDLKTREIEFIKNPYSLFQRVFYNDENVLDEIVLSKIDESIEDCYIKVFVEKKTNPYLFDMFLNKLETFGPTDIKIIETLIYNNDENTEELEQLDDTQTILKKSVDNLDISYNKTKLKNFMLELYNQALSVQMEN